MQNVCLLWLNSRHQEPCSLYLEAERIVVKAVSICKDLIKTSQSIEILSSHSRTEMIPHRSMDGMMIPLLILGRLNYFTNLPKPMLVWSVLQLMKSLKLVLIC
jgi:hypothetical protein